MDDHDNICLCFHVSVQKVKKFIRLNKPVRESQLSECYGAGTGCGWCRPFLKTLFDAETSEDRQSCAGGFDISPEEYARQRRDYHKQSGIEDRDDP